MLPRRQITLRRWAQGPLHTSFTAALECQQIGDEIILSADPELRFRPAPREKGLLALNNLLSIGYAISNWTGTDPYMGDLATADRTGGTHAAWDRGAVDIRVRRPRRCPIFSAGQ